MKKLNLAILGAGRIGITHAKNIILKVPIAKLIAIADPYIKDQTIKELKEMGIQLISKNIDEVIINKDVDAFVIGTPTSTHINLIKKIIKTNNKPIFCEKPLSLDWHEIPNLIKLAKKNKSFVQMGYNRRFDINFQLVKESIKKNKIGTPYLFSIASFDPFPPPLEYTKISGGIWNDMNIHDFDMMRFISEQEVEEVFVFGANLITPNLKGIDVDVTTINLKFTDGTLGVIRASRKSVYGYDQRIEVLGSKGRVKIDNVRNNTFKLDTIRNREISNPSNFFMDRYPDAYANEIKSFVESIIHNKKPIVSLYDDLQAEKIAAACKESFKKQKPIKIQNLK